MVISTASAVGALTAAYFAGRSSSAARRSARTSERQAQLAFIESVRQWQPPVAMDISRVNYRWSTSSTWTQLGTATDPGIASDDEITWKNAVEKELSAEVIIRGELINKTSDSMLLTIHRSKDSDIRYTPRNEGLFLIDGQDQSRWLLAAKSRLNFTWIDRRSFDEWRHLYIATGDRNIFKDVDLNLPHSSFRATAKNSAKKLFNPLHNPAGLWKEHVIAGSGFEVVAENRTDERVSTVWRVELHTAPVEAFGRDTKSQDLTWRLGRNPAGIIDDDVIYYRCRPDTTLAQISPPAYRAVPGRS